MRKNILLLILGMISTASMAQEIDENILENATYLSRKANFRANPLKKGQAIFLGDSLTQGGEWDEYFPNEKPANRGIAGDNTEGMLARIHEVIAAKPSKLFIMAGANDISLQRDNAIIIRQLKMLLRQVQAGSPTTTIYVQSALPICNAKLKYQRMKEKESVIEDYNDRLKSLCKEMDIPYIDIYSGLLSGPSSLNPEFTADGLHLNNAAYAIWAEIVGEYIN